MKRRLPHIGNKVEGAVFSPLDGHANPLLLMRALHTYLTIKGSEYRPAHPVETIERTLQGYNIKGNGVRFDQESWFLPQVSVMLGLRR